MQNNKFISIVKNIDVYENDHRLLKCLCDADIIYMDDLTDSIDEEQFIILKYILEVYKPDYNIEIVKKIKNKILYHKSTHYTIEYLNEYIKKRESKKLKLD